MVAAMALAPAPSPIAVLGTAWTWNLGAPPQTSPPCRFTSLHIASTGLGEGKWLSAQTQPEMLGVKRIRCPAPESCAVLFLRRARAQHTRLRNWERYRSLQCPGLSQISCVTLSRPLTGRNENSYLSFRSGHEH